MGVWPYTTFCCHQSELFKIFEQEDPQVLFAIEPYKLCASHLCIGLGDLAPPRKQENKNKASVTWRESCLEPWKIKNKDV